MCCFISLKSSFNLAHLSHCVCVCLLRLMPIASAALKCRRSSFRCLSIPLHLIIKPLPLVVGEFCLFPFLQFWFPTVSYNSNSMLPPPRLSTLLCIQYIVFFNIYIYRCVCMYIYIEMYSANIMSHNTF